MFCRTETEFERECRLQSMAIDVTDRKTVIALREKALAMSRASFDELWKEAYLALACAADRIDAMIARSN